MGSPKRTAEASSPPIPNWPIRGIVSMKLTFPFAAWIRGSAFFYHSFCRSEAWPATNLTLFNWPCQKSTCKEKGVASVKFTAVIVSTGNGMSFARGGSRPNDFITWPVMEDASDINIETPRRCSPDQTNFYVGRTPTKGHR